MEVAPMTEMMSGVSEPEEMPAGGEDELDERGLVVGKLCLSNEYFLAGEERRARVVSRSYGYQAQPYRRFLGRIVPAKLSFGLPACAANTIRGQKKQGCNPFLHADINTLFGWACHTNN